MVGKTKTSPYDSAKYLKTEEDMAAYFAVCLEEAGDDAAFIAHALGDIARARGMTQLAKDTVYHLTLGLHIKIDHYVAQKNHVKFT